MQMEELYDLDAESLVALKYALPHSHDTFQSY